MVSLDREAVDVVQPAGALADLRRRGQQSGAAREPEHPLAAGVDAAQPQPGAELLVALADERRLVDLPTDRGQQLVVGQGADGAEPAT